MLLDFLNLITININKQHFYVVQSYSEIFHYIDECQWLDLNRAVTAVTAISKCSFFLFLHTGETG